MTRQTRRKPRENITRRKPRENISKRHCILKLLDFKITCYIKKKKLINGRKHFSSKDRNQKGQRGQNKG